MSDMFDHELDAYEQNEAFHRNGMYDDTYKKKGGTYKKNNVISKKPKKCSRCGKENLHWVSTLQGWRLADEDGIHACKTKKIK
jgi:hypothetical protein